MGTSVGHEWRAGRRAICLLWFAGFVPACAFADGAYLFSVMKKPLATPTVVVQPIGEQALESSAVNASGQSSVPVSSSANSMGAVTTLSVSPEETYAGRKAAYEEMRRDHDRRDFFSEAPFLAYLGVTGGLDFWTAPLPTRLRAQGETWWDARPAVLLNGIGLVYNVSLFEFLDIEPKALYWFGHKSRTEDRGSGFAQESLSVSGCEIGLEAILPLLRPGFIQVGWGARYLSNSLDLQTDLPAFAYDGFLLDVARMTDFSLGLGIVSPPDWPMKLRLAVIGYTDISDFGSTTGIQVRATAVLPGQP